MGTSTKPKKRMGRPPLHGGETAIRALATGEPFSGMAAQAEMQVRRGYERDGLLEVMRTDAIRLETVARIFYGAVLKAADDGDLTALDRYVQRYGWLQGCALRAWGQLSTEQRAPNRDDGIIEGAIAAAKEAMADE